MSHIQHSSYSTSSTEACGIAEALFEGCIPPVRAPCSSAIELSIAQLLATVPITSAG